MIHIGVVGCGTMARRHLNAFSNIEDVKIEAVCDINAELARSMGKKFHIKSYSNYKDLVKDKSVDAIDICIPTTLHHEVVLYSLDNNKHIFCEKPLTYKLEYVELIKEKLSQNKRILMTGYLYNFHPSFQRLKLLLKENIIGRPYFAIFRVGGRGSRKIWKHKKNTGGGTILEMMVHMLDLVINYFNSIDEVEKLYYDTILKHRYVENKEIEADAEDCVYVRMRSKAGVEIICESDLISPSYMNYVEVHGDNGSFFGSILDYLPTIVFCKEKRGIYNQGINTFNNPRIDLVSKELRHFIQVLKGLAEPPDSIKKELEIFKIIEEVRRQEGLRDIVDTW